MKRILLLLTVAMLCNISLFAQSKKITGTVVDKDSQPLMGVQVKSESGDVAVTTDLEGRFEITVPEGSKLTFSMLGTKSQTKVATDGMTVVLGNEIGKWDWRKQVWNHIILAEYGFNATSTGGHSLGIRYGMCHYVGWFVGAKYVSSNFQFPVVEYTMGSGGSVYDPYVGRGTPVMTGRSNFNQFTLSGGLLWRMYIPLYGYAGVGYGYRKTSCETTGRKWLYTTGDRNLVTAEFGLMGDIYGFTLSAGCGLVFAERMEVYPTFGIGYTFPMKKGYSNRNAK